MALTPASSRGSASFDVLDAKGDLIVASAADTAARLAVGTPGLAVIADPNEANGIKWAADARRQIELGARGIIAETADLKTCGVAVASTAGTMVAGLVGLREGDVVTSIGVFVTVNASTATLCKAALYSAAGVLLASSADVDTDFNSGTQPRLVVVTLTAPFTILADGGYYLAFLSVGGTSPTLLRGTAQVTAAYGAGSLASVFQSSLSDLPAPAVFVAGGNGIWLAAA